MEEQQHSRSNNSMHGKIHITFRNSCWCLLATGDKSVLSVKNEGVPQYGSGSGFRPGCCRENENKML